MLISYAITVCNEYDEIKHLLSILTSYKHKDDEIVVLFDSKNGSNQVYEYLTSIPDINCVVSEKFDNDFSEWKNILNDNCNGDYIFQLDADEYVSENLIINLPFIIKNNLNVELFYFPRINIVENITLENILNWGWSISKSENHIEEKVLDFEQYSLLKKYDLIIDENINKIKYFTPIINKPDYQGRLYKKNLKWIGKVHERINAENIGILPDEEQFNIIHKKTIEKQIKQNNFYKEINDEKS